MFALLGHVGRQRAGGSDIRQLRVGRNRSLGRERTARKSSAPSPVIGSPAPCSPANPTCSSPFLPFFPDWNWNLAKNEGEKSCETLRLTKKLSGLMCSQDDCTLLWLMQQWSFNITLQHFKLNDRSLGVQFVLWMFLLPSAGWCSVTRASRACSLCWRRESTLSQSLGASLHRSSAL